MLWNMQTDNVVITPESHNAPTPGRAKFDTLHFC